jgi:hypothetical protein
VLTHSGLAWAGLTLLLLWLVSFRRRYDRERMARLRANELPEEPAWWDGGDAGGAGQGPEAEGASSRQGKDGGHAR